MGAVPNSGWPNTSEQLTTRGGVLNACVYSGGALSPGSGFLPSGAAQTGDHILISPGAGRLNNVFVHGNAVLTLSGVTLAFYDGATVGLSGPGTWNAGGRRLLFGTNMPGGVSGGFTAAGFTQVDMPYNSGLCVAACSGTQGWTISFTPEHNHPLGN
jgi:hypothetical protein